MHRKHCRQRLQQEILRFGLTSQVVSQHTDMHAQEVIDMHKAMLNFTGSVHSDRLDYINELLAACYKV